MSAVTRWTRTGCDVRTPFSRAATISTDAEHLIERVLSVEFDQATDDGRAMVYLDSGLAAAVDPTSGHITDVWTHYDDHVPEDDRLDGHDLARLVASIPVKSRRGHFAPRSDAP